MAASRDGVLMFNPLVAGVAGDAGAGAGGGIIGGAGVFYSKPTSMGSGGWSDITDVLVVTGDLAGTMVAEVANSSDDEEQVGTGAWVVDTGITIAAIVAGSFLVKAPRIGFGRYRLRFTRASGTGTIADRRVVKAS